MEKKFVDTSVASCFPVATTWNFALVNGIAPGTGSSARIGSRIEVKSIAFRVNCQTTSNATNGSPLRVRIFYDKESNGAAPAATDVFNQNDINGMNNLLLGGRFITLFDKTWDPVLSGVGGAGAGAVQGQTLEGYVKVNLPVKYNAGIAGTVADIVSGSIYFATCQNGVFSPQLDEALVRIRYTDI